MSEVAEHRTNRRSPGHICVAVVGCGVIAHHHLSALRDLAGVRIAGVCDSSPSLASVVGEMYRSDSVHDDLGAMLAEVRPDVLHVLTPPHTHEALVTSGLDAGCHVIAEKPLALHADSTDRMLDLAAANGLLLMESQNLRYNDAILAIDRMAASGDLGEVREVDLSLRLDLTAGQFGDLNLGAAASMALPGGAVHDVLPHLVYLFLHLAGSDQVPLETIAGELVNRSGNPRVGCDSLDVLVRAGEVRGRLHVASDLAPDAFRVAVRGTERSVETDLYNPFLRVEGGRAVGKLAPVEQVRSGSQLIVAGTRNLVDKVRRHDTMHGLPRMLQDFYAAVATGRPAPIGPGSMRATAVSIDRILASVRGPVATPQVVGL
jgi:predicted dehydrogenase